MGPGEWEQLLQMSMSFVVEIDCMAGVTKGVVIILGGGWDGSELV